LEGYRLTMAAGLELGNRLFDTEDIMDEAEAGALAKGGHLATGGEDQQAIALFGCERTQLIHRRLELSDQFSRPLLLAEDLAQQQGIAFHAAQQVVRIGGQVDGGAEGRDFLVLALGATAENDQIRLGSEIGRASCRERV